MKFETKVFLMRQKYYFDLGVGITSLLIKVLAVVGIAAAIEGVDKRVLAIFGLSYGVFCYFLGFIYVKYKWLTASIEVENRLNIFVREMREKVVNNKRFK